MFAVVNIQSCIVCWSRSLDDMGLFTLCGTIEVGVAARDPDKSRHSTYVKENANTIPEHFKKIFKNVMCKFIHNNRHLGING